MLITQYRRREAIWTLLRIYAEVVRYSMPSFLYHRISNFPTALIKISIPFSRRTDLRRTIKSRPISCYAKKRVEMDSKGVTKLAIIGDVHDLWDDVTDVTALGFLMPDITLFVGDIGNENVPLVREIAEAPIEKAVVLGNHDAFYSTPERRYFGCGDDGDVSSIKRDRINTQLDDLHDDHVGFSSKKIPGKNATIVGARPFSSGGDLGNSDHAFYDLLYGLSSIEEYAHHIVKTVLTAPKNDAILIMGHNGPSGLGEKREDICGVDFYPNEGDHGDLDLEMALNELKGKKRSPALVTFGHMHSHLNNRYGGGNRKRVVYDIETGTLFLNTAVCPRIKISVNGSHKIHHFCMVTMEDGRVTNAKDVYVAIKNKKCEIQSEKELFSVVKEEGGTEYARVFNCYLNCWERMEMAGKKNAVVDNEKLR